MPWFTTFDRYLLRRYWHVFFIAYVALFGLYVIIDAFTNVDDFMERPGGPFSKLWGIIEFYSYRASQFFDIIGGTVAVIAAMVVFSLVLRHGELNPILSAGVPTYRLVVPLLWGTLLVNGALVANQEFLIPRIASELQVAPGKNKSLNSDVEPAYDFATQIYISGKRMELRDKRLEEAEFVLPSPQIADKVTTIQAREAVFRPAAGKRPSGWVLTGTDPTFDKLPLTDRGRKYVRPGPTADQVFVKTEVGFDRLYNRDKNFEFLSTRELMHRIKNVSFGVISIRAQSLYLHTRFAKPFINLIVVLLGLPLIARRESAGIITNLALCAAAMGTVFGICQAFLYLGKVNLIAPDLAAWAPVILCGTASAWMSGLVRS